MSQDKNKMWTIGSEDELNGRAVGMEERGEIIVLKMDNLMPQS